MADPDPNTIAAPDLQGALPGSVPQAPPPFVSPPSQQQQGVPRMGTMPAIVELAKGLIQGGRGTVQPGAAQPQRPGTRLDSFENFMGTFLTSFATGLGASGHGPGANERGAAAAMMAPYQQQVNRFQQGLQQRQVESQEGLRQAQEEFNRSRAQQYDMMPMQVPDANGKMQTIMVPTNAMGRIQAAIQNRQGGENKAQIGQGMQVDVPKDLQEQFGAPAKLPLKQLNALESAANKPLTTVQGATDSYVVNKRTGDKTALGVGSGRVASTLARPVQVADPNTPGGIKYMPAGEAMRTGAQAAGSAAVTAPKSVIKDFTSGASAKTLNSFNTATDHLKILSQLGDALDNGSVPLINNFANKYATATGGAAPTSFDMAKQAVAGEIAKTFKGQATEGEISAINSTLNNAQSPAQLKGAINTALTLMESKRAALMEQYDQGIKAQPAFPKSGKVTAADMLKKYAPR